MPHSRRTPPPGVCTLQARDCILSYLEWMLHISHAVVRLVPVDMCVAEHVDIAAEAAQLALQAAGAAYAP